MPRSLFILAAGLWMFFDAQSGLAQRHEIPVLNSCIKSFYDPGMYGYLTYQNKCSQSLTVVYVAEDKSGASGVLELRPGGKDSVGKIAGRSPKASDFALYVCPSGTLPLDEKGEMVTKPRMNFRCQPKPR